jgi:hypothetical protein
LTDRSDGLESAIDTFLTFPRRLAEISARAQDASTGPWTVHVSTRVGSFLLRDQRDHSFEVTMDYPELRQATYRIRDQVEDDLGETWPAITAAQDWLDEGAPSLSQALTATRRTDRSGMRDSLYAVGQMAQEGERILASAACALAAAASAQRSHVGDVAALHNRVTEEHLARAAQLRLAVAQQPGGHQDFETQLVLIRSLAATTQSVLTACVHTLVAEIAAASAAVARLSGAARELGRDLDWMRISAEQGWYREASDFTETISTWRSATDHMLAIRSQKLLRSPLRPASLRARANARRY